MFDLDAFQANPKPAKPLTFALPRRDACDCPTTMPALIDTTVAARIEALVPALMAAIAQKNDVHPDLGPKVSPATWGEGGFVALNNAKAATLVWKHTPALLDDYMIVCIGVTIPDTVPAGSQWPDRVFCDGQELPMLSRVLTSGAGLAGVDATRGFIELFGAPIKPDFLQKERQVTVQISTGKLDNYTLRGNSASVSNYGDTASVPTKQGTTGANAATAITVNGTEVERLIGAAFNASKPGPMELVTTSSNRAAPVELAQWRHDNEDGQPFIMFDVAGAANRTVTANYPGDGPYKRGMILTRLTPPPPQ